MSSTLSWQQVAQYAYNAGFRGTALAIATAITEPESSRDPSIVQSGQPAADTGWGLWQITPGNAGLLDPQTNADAAFAKYQAAGNSFTPWTTYTGGEYLQYMSQATAAAQSVQGTTTTNPAVTGAGVVAGALTSSLTAPAQGVGNAITSTVGDALGGLKIAGFRAEQGGLIAAGVVVFLVGGTILFLSTDVGKATVREARRGVSTAVHVAAVAAA